MKRPHTKTTRTSYARGYYHPRTQRKPVKVVRPIIPALLSIALAFILLAMVSSAKACEEVYLKVGAGYKIRSEMMLRHQGVRYHLEDESHPVSFRGELGCQSGRITYGVAKYSQWLQGWPVDNETETNRIEVFVDVKFTLWGS